jgi:hypothetical protein
VPNDSEIPEILTLGNQSEPFPSLSSVLGEDDIPDAFFRALADFGSDRVVDADRSLNEIPPEV